MRSEPENSPSKQIEYFFRKTKGFRNVYCTGCFGAIQDGNLHLTVYSERKVIPKSVVFEQDEEGLVREMEEKRKSKDGIMCDVEANLIFSPETAIEFYSWLKAMLDEAVTEGLIANEA